MSQVTISALTTIVSKEDSYSLSPRKDIPQASYCPFLVKIAILLCYKQADQQLLDLVQLKVHKIRALGPLWPLRPFMMWFHTSLSLEGAPDFHNFLPKRTDLVRQQQYVWVH